MGKCKNIECENETINKKIYCSLKCRNYFVNKFVRDYTKNGEGLSKVCEDTYKQNIKFCENPKCNKELAYEKRENKYCNHSCAAAITNHIKKGKPHVVSDKALENILKANREKSGYKIGEYESNPKLCLNCNKILAFKKRNYNFCCLGCRKEHKRKTIDNFLSYKADSKFTFSLNEFPNAFDFDLIKKYGWYSPSNSRTPNISGISRDHMLSVSDGFKLGIDPKILSHPANCKLMIHSENISKNKRSSINIEELLIRIEEWGNT